MPPKSALNSNKNKKSASEPCVSHRTDAGSASTLDPEAKDRFELELCWCIQQMEASLAGGKLQEKQVQELSKQLHSLKSNTAPLVKKRQIMRNTLGDYREKMAEDERKFSKTVSAVKFTDSTSLEKKSIFIKKAAGYSTQNSNRQTDDHRTENTLQSTEQTVCNSNKTESPFKFNF
ncbi:PREDICTED: UPF0488 protein CG14286 [Trachymyrmex cornetzi]|uniref:UPF0488 protein CG14286 n=1 Tax=Trachymyrmex cornetzi TaxID=471704 RepID=UPI00084F3B6A|nr:PREDICTED: UPF0488 protein CG14286 [Trachymyrmex cornetzi]